MDGTKIGNLGQGLFCCSGLFYPTSKTTTNNASKAPPNAAKYFNTEETLTGREKKTKTNIAEGPITAHKAPHRLRKTASSSDTVPAQAVDILIAKAPETVPQHQSL